MERRPPCRLATVLGLAVLCASSVRAQDGESADAAAVLAEVNRIRAAHGLAAVAADPALMEAAADYASELKGRPDLDHIGRDGSTPPLRAEKAGYAGGNVAETLAAGYDAAADAVEAWMESPSHRDVILKADAAYAGVAREEAPDTEYKSYWTMLVAGPEPDDRERPAE